MKGQTNQQLRSVCRLTDNGTLPEATTAASTGIEHGEIVRPGLPPMDPAPEPVKVKTLEQLTEDMSAVQLTIASKASTGLFIPARAIFNFLADAGLRSQPTIVAKLAKRAKR